MTRRGESPDGESRARQERLKALIQQLAEIERAIQAESSERIDAVVDDSSASLILLRAAQEALVESESRYRRLVTRTSALVFELAPDGTTRFANDAVETILGYRKDEVLGADLWALLFPPSRRNEADDLAERLAAGDVTRHEITLTAKDGSLATLELTTANRYAQDGRLETVTGLGIDVTERKLAERERERLFESEQGARRQAEEASRAKDEFLAMVSHELRTPLNAIVGWMRLLRSGRLDDDTFRRGLETIERNVQSQAQLIDDLLDISRIITGKLRLDVRPVHLETTIEAALDAVRPAADAKGIELVSEVDAYTGLVSGDPGRLQQVVWNLLSNAIKFTPKDGRVSVGLRRVDSSVEVAVSDSGQGISPDFLPYVFDRFRQADGAITRQYGGLGLGLAIVRHIVELHGGTVEAASDGDGLGSTFSVRLPVLAVRREHEPNARRSAPPAAPHFDCPPALEGIRILVVDDEPDTRELLKVMLEQCGAEVETAGSAAEALGALAAWRPTILVSDIGMPGEDGYELIRKIRQLGADEGRAIPALALTAYARPEDRLRALAAGFEMHVAKPVEPAELVMVIERLVRLAGQG